MLIGRNRGLLFLSFPFTEGKITHPNSPSGGNTYSSLTEHAISTFSRFLRFLLLQQQRILSGSFKLDYLSRIVCAKSTWKSSATAIKEIPKGEISFLTINSKDYFCQKLKT